MNAFFDACHATANTFAQTVTIIERNKDGQRHEIGHSDGLISKMGTDGTMDYFLDVERNNTPLKALIFGNHSHVPLGKLTEDDRRELITNANTFCHIEVNTANPARPSLHFRLSVPEPAYAACPYDGSRPTPRSAFPTYKK